MVGGKCQRRPGALIGFGQQRFRIGQRLVAVARHQWHIAQQRHLDQAFDIVGIADAFIDLFKAKHGRHREDEPGE